MKAFYTTLSSIKKSFRLLLLTSTKWYYLLHYKSLERIETSPPNFSEMERFLAFSASFPTELFVHVQAFDNRAVGPGLALLSLA
jgi:hypothetical protein